MHAEKYSTDEVRERASKIYENDIRHLVEPKHNGRFVVIDIESGDYEIGDDDITAEERLEERRPGCQGHLFRIGCESAFVIGWGGNP
ncbi:MAG: hypothetical protein OXI91_01805 [Chloroflexota bacterium]|nr:hypothetical protein [Chloroflexota bacterium]